MSRGYHGEKIGIGTTRKERVTGRAGIPIGVEDDAESFGLYLGMVLRLGSFAVGELVSHERNVHRDNRKTLKHGRADVRGLLSAGTGEERWDSAVCQSMFRPAGTKTVRTRRL